jgi:hypothetical protein
MKTHHNTGEKIYKIVINVLIFTVERHGKKYLDDNTNAHTTTSKLQWFQVGRQVISP